MEGAGCCASAADAHACATPSSSARLTPRASRGFSRPFPGLRFWLQPRRVAVLSAFGCPLRAAPLPACSSPLRAPGSKGFRVVGVLLAKLLLWRLDWQHVLTRSYLLF